MLLRSGDVRPVRERPARRTNDVSPCQRMEGACVVRRESAVVKGRSTSLSRLLSPPFQGRRRSGAEGRRPPVPGAAPAEWLHEKPARMKAVDNTARRFPGARRRWPPQSDPARYRANRRSSPAPRGNRYLPAPVRWESPPVGVAGFAVKGKVSTRSAIGPARPAPEASVRSTALQLRRSRREQRFPGQDFPS